MHRRILLAPLLILTLISVVHITTGSTATAPDVAVAASQGAPPGFYVIGSRILDRGYYPIAGDMKYWHWAHVQTGPNQFDWSILDNYLDTHGADGRPIGFAFTTYEGRGGGGVTAMPQWAQIDGPPNDDEAMVIRLPDGYPVPKYWSSGYLQHYGEFVQALGEHYRNDPRIAWIGIGTGIYGETQPVEQRDDSALADLGLTPALWVQTTNAITDMYIEAFSEGGSLKKPLLLQNGPFFLDPVERRDFSLYAAQRNVGLSVNSLYADGNSMIRANDPICPNCGAMDSLVAYWRWVPIAFELYPTTLPSPTEFYWGMLNALDKHSDFLRLRRQFMVEDDGREHPETIEIMRWVAPYLGATANTAPSAWVAMREHRNPVTYGVFGTETSSWYPQWGNYDFFLTQDDSIPGGRTVPETNDPTVTDLKDNADPYNPWLPRGKEGWVIRRTDEATDNHYMYLKVDREFISGSNGHLTIRVTYLDRGNDRWELTYDSPTGPKTARPEGSDAGWVQKTNTNRWRVATFHLTDAFFSTGTLAGGSDFQIDSTGDGNEWIHFVEVLHGVPSTPTPMPTRSSKTPTPTRVISWTPAATSTQRPTTKPTEATSPQPTQVQYPMITINQPETMAFRGPGFNFDYIGTVDQGTQYPVLGRNAEGTWGRICCVKGSIAWLPFAAGDLNVSIDTIRIVPVPLPPTEPRPTPTPEGYRAATPTPRPSPTSTPQPTPTSSSPYGQVMMLTITKDPTMGRSGPGEVYSTVGTLHAGERIMVLGRESSSQWVKGCCVAGRLTWVPTSSGTLDGPIESVRVVPTPAP